MYRYVFFLGLFLTGLVSAQVVDPRVLSCDRTSGEAVGGLWSGRTTDEATGFGSASRVVSGKLSRLREAKVYEELEIEACVRAQSERVSLQIDCRAKCKEQNPGMNCSCSTIHYVWERESECETVRGEPSPDRKGIRYSVSANISGTATAIQFCTVSKKSTRK